jgi:hypothetical protein
LLGVLATLVVVSAIAFMVVFYPILSGTQDQRRADAKADLERLGCKVEVLGAEATITCPKDFKDGQLKKLPDSTREFESILLILKDTEVTAVGTGELKPLTNLKLLDLSGLALTDGCLANLEGLSRLQHLHLTKTGIGDEGLIHLRPLKALQRLFLEGNPGVTSKGLVYLVQLPELRDLRLDMTKVDDQGLVTLSQMKQLQRVWLRNVPGITPSGITNLKQALPELTVKR